jgi:hypothetical protein
MILTKFRSAVNHEFYERVMPYPVRVGDFVSFDDSGGISWEVIYVEWVIEQNPDNQDETHCTLNVKIK